MLNLRRVATTLINGRSDFVKAAQRLHTRIDVHWDDMSGSGTDEPVKVPFVEAVSARER